MDAIQHQRPPEVMITRLPRRGLIPGLFLGIMILGPGLTAPEFSLLWMVRLVTVVLVIRRITQIRLGVDNESVVVTNFFRTVRIPHDEVSIPFDQPTPGFLELRTAKDTTVHVGAAPSWGSDLHGVRQRLVDEIERQRGWR